MNHELCLKLHLSSFVNNENIHICNPKGTGSTVIKCMKRRLCTPDKLHFLLIQKPLNKNLSTRSLQITWQLPFSLPCLEWRHPHPCPPRPSPRSERVEALARATLLRRLPVASHGLLPVDELLPAL